MQLWTGRHRGVLTGHQHWSAQRLHADNSALHLLERALFLLLYSEGGDTALCSREQLLRVVVLELGRALGVREGEHEDLYHAWFSADRIDAVIGRKQRVKGSQAASAAVGYW